jgi:hypothetical protein
MPSPQKHQERIDKFLAKIKPLDERSFRKSLFQLLLVYSLSGIVLSLFVAGKAHLNTIVSSQTWNWIILIALFVVLILVISRFLRNTFWGRFKFTLNKPIEPKTHSLLAAHLSAIGLSPLYFAFVVYYLFKDPQPHEPSVFRKWVSKIFNFSFKHPQKCALVLYVFVFFSLSAFFPLETSQSFKRFTQQSRFDTNDYSFLLKTFHFVNTAINLNSAVIFPDFSKALVTPTDTVTYAENYFAAKKGDLKAQRYLQLQELNEFNEPLIGILNTGFILNLEKYYHPKHRAPLVFYPNPQARELLISKMLSPFLKNELSFSEKLFQPYNLKYFVPLGGLVAFFGNQSMGLITDRKFTGGLKERLSEAKFAKIWVSQLLKFDLSFTRGIELQETYLQLANLKRKIESPESTPLSPHFVFPVASPPSDRLIANE